MCLKMALAFFYNQLYITFSLKACITTKLYCSIWKYNRYLFLIYIFIYLETFLSLCKQFLY